MEDWGTGMVSEAVVVRFDRYKLKIGTTDNRQREVHEIDRQK